jgi:hypothetical protein
MFRDWFLQPKMATVLEDYLQRSLVRFLWAKMHNAKDIHKEMFPVYGVTCLSSKAVHNWVEKRGERFSVDE